MVFDFAFVLVALSLLTGLIWGLDHWVFAPRRGARGNAKEPLLVDYARSFFPVIVIVLVLRSFLYEPFRIPSDSMMPTLVQGDFIFVNKWRYGLRLPVVNWKLLPVGKPQRGDAGRRRGIAADRLQHQRIGHDADLAELLGDDEAMLLVGDDQRWGETLVAHHPEHGLLQQAALAGQRQELLRVERA